MKRFAEAAPFDAMRRQLRTEGKPHLICRQCGKVLEGCRTSFCTNSCADDFMCRRNGSYMRRLVYRRDRGVCKLCRVDTAAIRDRLRVLRFGNEMIVRRGGAVDPVGLCLLEGRLTRAGYDLGRSFWEANHIVPVYLGGGGCGIENIETLCRHCHRKVTAGQAAERARVRNRMKNAATA